MTSGTLNHSKWLGGCVGRAVFLGSVLGALMAVPLLGGAANASESRENQAERLLRDFNELLQRRAYGEAHGLANKALRIYEEVGDLSAQAAILSLVAACELGLERRDTALASFAEAQSRARRGKDDFALAAIARDLGRLTADQRRVPEAEDLFQQALAALNRLRLSGRSVAWFEIHHASLGLPFDQPLRLNAKATLTTAMLDAAEAAVLSSLTMALLMKGGSSERAEAALDRAQGLATVGDKALGGALLSLRGRLQFSRGAVVEARANLIASDGLLRVSCCTVRGDEGLQLAVANLYLLSEIDSKSGRLEEALAWINAALELGQGSGEAGLEPRLLLKRAEIQTLQADRQAALQSLSEANRLALQAGDADALERSRFWLAKEALTSGRVQDAAAGLSLSAGGASETGDPCLRVFSWMMLAQTYLTGGSAQLAQQALSSALDQLREHPCKGMEDLVKVASWVILEGGEPEKLTETFEQSLGDFPDAAVSGRSVDTLALTVQLLGRKPGGELLPKLLEQLQSAIDRKDLGVEAHLRLLLGEVHRRGEAPEEAGREWETARDLARRQGDSALELNALRSLARLNWREGRREAAISNALELVRLQEVQLKQTGVDELLLGLSSGQVSDYDLLIEMLLATHQADLAFLYSERARSRALLRLLGNPRLNPKQGGDPRLVAEAERLLAERHGLEKKQATKGGGDGFLAAEIQRLKAHYDEITLRLKLSNPQYADLNAVDSLNGQEIQALLPTDAALVSFYFLSESAVAWVIDSAQIRLVRLPISRDLVRGAVERLRQDIASRQPLPVRGSEALMQPTPAESPADELYLGLWAPLRPHLHHSRVILVPHDALHSLPYAALREPETGRFVLEDFELSYAPSASAVPFLKDRVASATRAPLVLGDPVLPPAWGLLPLTGARQEARAAASRLGTEPLLGEQASETAFRGRAKGATVLHVAAHGVLLPHEPRFSYIALAADDLNDGKLEMHEILEVLAAVRKRGILAVRARFLASE